MFSFFRRLPFLFFERAVYLQIADREKGIGLGHMAVCAFISLLAVAIPLWQPWFDLKMPLQQVFDSFPEIRLDKGQLIMSSPGVYDSALPPGIMLHDRILIDPQEENNDLTVVAEKMRQGHILIWAMKNRYFFMATGDGLPEAHTYDPSTSHTITHDDWHRIGRVILGMAYPVGMLALLLFSFVQVFIAVLLAGVVFLIGAKMTGLLLDYKGALRLVAATKVPSFVLSTLLAMPAMVATIAWALWSLLAISALRRAQFPPVEKKTS